MRNETSAVWRLVYYTEYEGDERMLIPAYDKVYLEKARTALGRMLDFAVEELMER